MVQQTHSRAPGMNSLNMKLYILIKLRDCGAILLRDLHTFIYEDFIKFLAHNLVWLWLCLHRLQITLIRYVQQTLFYYLSTCFLCVFWNVYAQIWSEPDCVKCTETCDAISASWSTTTSLLLVIMKCASLNQVRILGRLFITTTASHPSYYYTPADALRTPLSKKKAKQVPLFFAPRRTFRRRPISRILWLNHWACWGARNV